MRSIALQNKLLAVFLALLITALAVLAPMTMVGAAKPDAAAAAKPDNDTIAGIVVTNPNFDILEAAAIRAGLVSALSGGQQLTVFAPTDAAFLASPFGKGSEAATIAYINSLPPEAVANVLLYHIINGRQTSASVLARSDFRTLSGERLELSEIVNAGPVDLDVSARNGVIHIIGGVLNPAN